MTDENQDNPTESDHAKADDPEKGAESEAVRGASIFDLFEPPPDVDPSHFGPIPVVDPDAPAAGSGTEPAAAESAAGESTPSSDDEFASIYELLPGGKSPASPDSASPDSTSPDSAGAASLPKWTDPPTGQVPAVIGDNSDGWADVDGPSWKGDGPDQGEASLSDVLGTENIAPHSGPRVSIDDDEVADLPSAAGAPQREQITNSPRQQPQRRTRPASPVANAADDLGERNIPQAILVGAIFAGLGLFAFQIGVWTTLILIAAIAALGTVELFSTMRSRGLHPATLLGITAAVAMPFAIERAGAEGFMMVSGLSIVFGALWYLVGADTHKPTLNLGLTLLGIHWVGGMAAFGALIATSVDGISILLAAVVCTVFFDTAAFAGGKAIGRTPFHPASKNKTWEGTLAGVAGAIVGAFIICFLLEVNAKGFAVSWQDTLYLGLAVGILAPLGDLTESMIKRDLGVKDMGTLLPGHGGMLDRLDGLLFVLPGVYYLARVLDFV